MTDRTRWRRLRPFPALSAAGCGLALALLLLQGTCSADALGPEAFEAPVLDGVRAVAGDAGGAGARSDLPAYEFLGQRDWPAVRLHAQRPLDWSRADALALDVENPDSAPFRLLLRVGDDPDATGDEHSLTGIAELAPHQRARVVLPLAARPLGMRIGPSGFLTKSAGELVIGDVHGSIDPHHVATVHISAFRSDADRSLRFGMPFLLRRTGRLASYDRIVDRFGQSVLGTWPEKVANDAQLRARWHDAEAETRQLARTAFALADAFGGVDAGTRLAATGFFRVEKTNGRWSLVTPAGHRFFSLGVDEVTASNPTRVAGRAWMFGGLPAPAGPPARPEARLDGRRTPATFDFGAADLERVLGPAWRPRWKMAVLQRLRAWGFNTLGNWSEAGVTDNGTMPYVTFYDFEGASAEVVMRNGRTLPDPFDPRFPAVADSVARNMTTSRRNDPFLIGYFSGNEMPWGRAGHLEEGIAAHVLALGPESPAKQAMVDGLRARYGSSEAFSSAWGIPALANWADVLARPVAWRSSPTPSARRDATEFQGRFADRYFRTVAQAIKRQDPNHLYLGTRFATFAPEVVLACAKWCDVLSFNVYGRSPEDAAAAWSPFDRPVLIGEFHLGTTDRGSFWPGMVDVGAEAERGPAYAAYLSAAVEDPDIVGCHWFRYADEPLTGRPYDGENGHVGLVAVTDIPFDGFVTAVAAANRRTLGIFADQGRADRRGTQ